MRAFSDHNPIAVAIYFLCVSGIIMLGSEPFILVTSLVGALSLYFARNGGRGWRTHLGFFGMFLVLSLINPLVSHNGVTVLFVINDAPITAEALLYGIFASGTVITVVYWFRSFSEIMSADKLLYLFGKLSPKLALTLSMGLRYVPLFTKQSVKISRAQTALGLYKDGNAYDRAKGGLRVFSVMTTWALENGIVTADSMTARGYGEGKRTYFSDFRMRRGDVLLLVLTLILTASVAVCFATGSLDFEFYPCIKAAQTNIFTAVGYICYGILAALPTLYEMGEIIKWKYLRSKI